MGTNKSGFVEKAIIYTYLLLLPFNSGLLRESLHSLSSSVSFIPHLLGIGLMAILIYSKKREYRPSDIVKKMIIIILLLNLSSLIMAIIQFKDLGTVFGRNTIVAATPHIMYYLQIMLAIVYNDYILNQIEIKKVLRVILTSFSVVLAIGYVQILSILSGGGIANSILELLGRLFFTDEVYVARAAKLNLMTPEASTAGAQMAVFIFPLLLALIKHKKMNRVYGIGLLLAYIPIIIFNNSSSGLLGIMICLFCFLFLISYRKKINIWNVRIMLLLTVLLVFLINFDTIKHSDFMERTFLKAVDTENLSTLHRTTSIYTNMQSLKEYPIMGVGNGIQGFYYMKYFPNWGFQSQESTELYYGEAGWPGSGAFVFTYLSAYGAVGLLLLCYAIYLINRNLRKFKNTSYHYIYDFAFIASIGLLFQAYSTLDIIGNFYVIFIISIAALRRIERNPVAINVDEPRHRILDTGFTFQPAVRSIP
ncbi:O-antigen ligase family protein [Cohnella abietis]|uniref:O-antigen ligase-related domain-containing protein n=1 Tax=Cohnella abietis TaxID=2507935 RepID=A0A3T1D114_9BACL|nr:O-antigen ligase family protein [Cohnella abietis]BBI31790.1 hypothetical protein KCTCHS21_11890 [Cohnella abietis]